MEVKVEIKVVSFGELNEANMVRDCSFSHISWSDEKCRKH